MFTQFISFQLSVSIVLFEEYNLIYKVKCLFVCLSVTQSVCSLRAPVGPWNDFCFCVTVNIILMPTHLSLKVCSNDDDDHHGGGNHIVNCNISCCAIVLACDLTSEQVM